ncbi:MAG: hypothetical protein ACW987_18370 [Candidatus Thorarchaeota archaeon]
MKAKVHTRHSWTQEGHHVYSSQVGARNNFSHYTPVIVWGKAIAWTSCLGEGWITEFITAAPDTIDKELEF